jgi:hypothetical protein
MNRTIQALLTIFLFTHSTFGQGTDTLTTDTLVVIDGSDTLTVIEVNDTLQVLEVSDTIPLFIEGNMEVADSLAKETEKAHSPYKAIMYALVLPGLGQGYNQKYFKIPIVWAAMGGAVYAITYNTRKYRDAAYQYALLPDDNNERILRGWRRYMELSYIALTVVYALQVVDAYVDAQLYSWDVNENLSMRVAPSLQPMMVPNSLTGQSYGLTCSFNLKGR